MRLLRWIAVAFSMYSRIPMPAFEWKDDDMSKGLMFFPLVGVVIGACSVGVYSISFAIQIPKIVTVLLLCLIPIVLTGGFHIDGYMDMTDALRSYQSREKKLQILKDPHIGAFAVIGVIKIALLFGVGIMLLTENWDMKDSLVLGLIYVLARCVSGISSVVFKKAKKDGMLHEETKHTNNAVVVVLTLQLLISGCVLLYLNIVTGLLILMGLVAVLTYYIYITYKQFGGVTGDTAGYLVTVMETVLVVILGIATWYGL